MPNFDGKQPQQYFLDSWAERWRSLQREKNLRGKQAVWTMLELITGVAKDKLHKRMGKRLNQVEDPEIVIKELYEIYDSQGNFRRARREFEDRDQKPNESLRDYLESLLALHREADQDSSLPSENERVCRRFLKGLRDPELAHPAMQRLLLAEKHRASEYDEDYLQKILTQAEAQKQAAKDEQKTQRRDPQPQQVQRPERRPLKTIAEESPQPQAEQAAVNFSSYQAPDVQLYATAPTSEMQEWMDNVEHSMKAIQTNSTNAGCFHCGEAGHLIRNCPVKNAGLPQTSKGLEISNAFNAARRDKQRLYTEDPPAPRPGGFTYRAPPAARGAVPPRPAPQTTATQSPKEAHSDHNLLLFLSTQMQEMKEMMTKQAPQQAATSTTRQVAQLEGTEYLDYTNLVAPGCPVDLPDSACAEDPQSDETKN